MENRRFWAGKEGNNPMNIRKPVDYRAMFTAQDKLAAANLSQTELYCEIGRLVSDRPSGSGYEIFTAPAKASSRY